MKTSCKIIEDLLPMYHDGICSEESSDLIEEHLRECPNCSQILASLRGEIQLEKDIPADDLKPLEEIHHQITKEKKRSGRKGAIVALFVLAAIFLIWTGIWYLGYAIHYDRLAKPLEKVNDQVAAMTTAGHTLEVGEHRIVLKHPGFLGEGGFIHVGDKEGMVIFLDEEYNEIGQNKEVWIELIFYPEFGGGYRYALNIDDGEKSWWTWITPELTYNYDLYDAANRPKEEIEIIEQLLIEHRDEIISLFDTVKNVWGIEFLAVK
jgi:hypothetical protein